MQWSVGKKLYAGFLSIIALAFVMVAIIWVEVIGSHKVANEIRNDDIPGVELYLVLIDEAGDVYRDALKIVSGDPNAATSYRENKNEFDTAMKSLMVLEQSSAKDANRLREIDSLMAQFTQQFETQVMPKLNGSFDSAEVFQSLDAINLQSLVKLEELLDAASADERREAETALNTLNDSFSTIENTILIASLILFGVALTIAYMLSKSITSRLTVLDSVAQKVASGDLTAEEITDNSGDELSNLARSVNQMQNSLTTLLRSINSVSAEVQSVTTELSAESSNIVQGASQQAEKANLIATAAEELSLTIAEVAQQGNSTYEVARQSESSAETGRQVISEMVNSIQQVSQQMSDMSVQMNELGSHGEQIGSVIKVIEDIAEQTNLLALNAAIEAARAGEFGRGFAVVADEVRALAERTTKATREVAGIIQAIQSGTLEAVNFTEENCRLVDIGVSQSSGAVNALEEIVEGASNVQSMINSIATAAEEQTAVTKEIASDITAISDISEQSLQQANSSSQNVTRLNSKVGELEALIGQFKLN
ncbi:methyl-accepting chemotaxis protein [Vibrio sp. T187]|uniref:methyl-accepting chemotaxis protein n=1 Tax=Vibrio TaxID=662 RepID=UPI0010CA1BD1|nr:MULTISPECIES: methyl-accepting chemotaxis protein [Vibrio]MBW3694696.1 methyl-accepting chemotaxis protein [Vibrio sp. T187]